MGADVKLWAWRALRCHGYFTSYNFNARHYTLAEIPAFDEFGLWRVRNIRFSRYGALTETVVALVRQSAAGYHATELGEQLGVPAAPALSRLTAQSPARNSFWKRSTEYWAASADIRRSRQFCYHRHGGGGEQKLAWELRKTARVPQTHVPLATDRVFL